MSKTAIKQKQKKETMIHYLSEKLHSSLSYYVVALIVLFLYFGYQALAEEAPPDPTVAEEATPEESVSDDPLDSFRSRASRAWSYMFKEDAGGILEDVNSDLLERKAAIEAKEQELEQEQQDLAAARATVETASKELDVSQQKYEAKLQSLSSCVLTAMNQEENTDVDSENPESSD